MRILIFLLALISAFFVSYIHAADLDYSDKKPPDTETQEYSRCNFYGDYQDSLLLPIAGDLNQVIHYCMSFIVQRFEQKNEGGCYSAPLKSVQNTLGSFSQTIWRINTAPDGTTACANDGTFSVNMQAFNAPSVVEEKCPNPDFPEYVHEYHELDQLYCLKEKEPEPPCPEPTGQELTQFSSFDTVCFNNEDGSQCQIQTDENGSYQLPLKYGTQESVACKEPDPEPVEPTKPDPTPEPDKPDDSPDPDQPNDPSEKEPDVESDSSSSSTELDALNKVNKNLDALNKNANNNSKSNDERLDTLIVGVKNTNELASSIKENTAATTNNTGKTLEEVGKAVEQLYEINSTIAESNSDIEGIASDISDISDSTSETADGIGTLNEGMNSLIEGIDGVNAALRDGDDGQGGEEDPISITATRKDSEKGLNSLFTDDDLATLKEEIDAKKDEFQSEIDTIKSEIESVMSLSLPSGGGYEQRIETIKGVQVDMGLGRISEYFRIIGTAIMLVASITALYILLGSKE